MSKNVLNEVNTMREAMGLPLLNENELLHLELSKINLDPLNEGWWENAKYALSKLGRYKAGGNILGKSQTDAKANAQIMALLDKKGNEMIKQLDSSIKAKNPEFPNNKSQEQYLTTILDIATVYDSIVAATKLKPNDAGFLPVDAANAIIEDLRAYAQKYLDVDLTAAFSVFNEGEVLDEEAIDEASNPAQQAAIAISKKEDGINEADENLDAAKAKTAGKFADTKAAIKKGDLEAYGTERMKTLRSWKLPLALMGTGASFGALSWLIEYLYGPKEIVESSREVIESKAEQALGNIKPGEGMTQIMNRTLGTSLSPSSNPNDVVSALSKLGGGDASKGVEIITQNGGIFRDPAAAKETLSAIVANPTEHGNNLKQVFSGTWAGTGKMAGDTLVTQNGGTLKQMVVTAIVKWTTKTTIKTTAAATIAAPILKVLGVGLLAGGVVAALSRYKGRKSSRAQVLNDLVQYLRPVEGTKDNQEVIGNEDGGGGNNQGGDKNHKSGSDNQLYINLKKYFQDLYNFRSQVNTDTYGKGGSGNAQKTYTGGGTINKNVVAPNDVDDLLKLMEEFEMVSEETLDDIGLSSNQLKLFKTNVQRLTGIIKTINKFNSQDKNLSNLLNAAKQNPVSTADINSMLESDAKSLKIFVSDFNKALYSIQFKNGNSIIDQLSKIQVNKLQEEEIGVDERAEREQPKGAMNKVYNDRRAFLGNLQGYVKTLYSIFSYLIDKMKSNPQGDAGEKQDFLPGQDQKSSEKAQSNQGLNAQQGTSSSIGGTTSGSLRDIGKTLEEGKRYTKEELSEMSAEMEEAVNPKTEAMLNSVNGKIFTQLAKVVPELSTRIATAYQQEYGETINKARLGKFLETVLGAMATVPQQRMVQIINRGDVDITAYKRMLKDLKNMEGEDGAAQPAVTASSFNPSSPEKFLPVDVQGYDLAGQKNSFRIGLAQKAAEIISRQTDMKLDEKNMLTVMKQLIDTLNSKHGGNIPKAQ